MLKSLAQIRELRQPLAFVLSLEAVTLGMPNIKMAYHGALAILPSPRVTSHR